MSANLVGRVRDSKLAPILGIAPNRDIRFSITFRGEIRQFLPTQLVSSATMVLRKVEHNLTANSKVRYDPRNPWDVAAIVSINVDIAYEEASAFRLQHGYHDAISQFLLNLLGVEIPDFERFVPMVSVYHDLTHREVRILLCTSRGVGTELVLKHHPNGTSVVRAYGTNLGMKDQKIISNRWDTPAFELPISGSREHRVTWPLRLVADKLEFGFNQLTGWLRGKGVAIDKDLTAEKAANKLFTDARDGLRQNRQLKSADRDYLVDVADRLRNLMKILRGSEIIFTW